MIGVTDVAWLIPGARFCFLSCFESPRVAGVSRVEGMSDTILAIGIYKCFVFFLCFCDILLFGYLLVVTFLVTRLLHF